MNNRIDGLTNELEQVTRGTRAAFGSLSHDQLNWKPIAVQVVECRFFAGLEVEETAEALDVSPATVMRDWRRGKAWLYRELASRRVPGVESGAGVSET